MKLKSLEKPLNAMGCVQASMNKITEEVRPLMLQIKELPDHFRADVIQEISTYFHNLSEAMTHPNAFESLNPSLFDGDEEHEEDQLPPSKAVLNALQGKPRGLTPDEIITAVKGKVKTESADPDRLVYSVLSQLRRTNQVMRMEDGRHVLAEYARI